MGKLKLFTNNEIGGYNPVGACVIAVAASMEDAITQMEAALQKAGIAQKINPKDMIEVDLTIPTAVVLLDGDY